MGPPFHITVPPLGRGFFAASAEERKAQAEALQAIKAELEAVKKEKR